LFEVAPNSVIRELPYFVGLRLGYLESRAGPEEAKRFQSGRFGRLAKGGDDTTLLNSLTFGATGSAELFYQSLPLRLYCVKSSITVIELSSEHDSK
jgi:hypothetical protein